MRASRITAILIVLPVVAALVAAMGYAYVRTQRAAFDTTADDVEKALYGGTVGPVELRGRTRTKAGSAWRETETVTRQARGRALITIAQGERCVTMLDDGQHLWQLGDRPTPVGPSSRKVDWARFRTAYKFGAGGAGTIAGRNACALRMVSRRTGKPAEVLWIGVPGRLPLARETYDADGHLVSASEVTGLEVAPAKEIQREIERAVSRLPNRPAGLSLADAEFASRAGFTPVRPQYLPMGYQELGLYARTCPRGRVYAELVYFDGLRVMSIFERPGGGPGGGQGRGFGHRRGQAAHAETAEPVLVDEGQAKTVRVRRGNVRVFVTADLTQEEILRVVNSIP